MGRREAGPAYATARGCFYELLFSVDFAEHAKEQGIQFAHIREFILRNRERNRVAATVAETSLRSFESLKPGALIGPGQRHSGLEDGAQIEARRRGAAEDPLLEVRRQEG